MRKVLFILGELTDGDVEWLIACGTRRQLASGAVLINEGVPTDALYVVLDGHFAVTAGKGATEVARIGAGEILGEMSFIDSAPPSATVTAVGAALVLGVSRESLAQKLKQDTAFAARFYRALAIFLSDRLRSAVGRMGVGVNLAVRASQHMKTQEDIDYEDALDMNVLDNVSMAGARFERILRQMRGG
jgi:CRP/FNR family cyclic AMP-dependent transcriptional regulator